MPFLTADVPEIAQFTGLESAPADTNAAAGANPQFVKIPLYKLALLMTTMLNTLDKTMVAGSIYYTAVVVGAQTSFDPDTALPVTRQNVQSFAVTGVNVAVGTPGGTDTWHVGVYNSSGVLVARSITAGILASTALTIQQFALYQTDGATIGPVTLVSGTYYVALQSNGTTAKFKAINSPVWPLITGSQVGAAGTLALLTPIPTTYTANLGPQVSFY